MDKWEIMPTGRRERPPNMERTLRHMMKRFDVKGKRWQRLEISWQKLSARGPALTVIMKNIYKGIKENNLDKTKIVAAEITIKDALAEANRVLVQLQKLERTNMRLPIQIAWPKSEWDKWKSLKAQTGGFIERYTAILKEFNELKKYLKLE